jgi:class 3 adenylate cyclase
VAEHDLVVVFVAWRNRHVFARGHLPQDVVYLSRLFIETVAGALAASGGTVSETRVDGVTALFGLAGNAAAVRGHARAAAIAIDHALAGLRRRYASEFGAPADFATFVHEGPGAVSGDPSGQAGHLLAAGEVFDTIAALSTADLGRHAAIVVTARATEGLALDAADAAWRRVAPGEGTPPMRVAVFAGADALQRTAPA